MMEELRLMGQGETFMLHKINVIIEQDDDGYYAYAPELEGCHSQGDSLDEVYANLREAVELYLETLTPDEIKPTLR